MHCESCLAPLDALWFQNWEHEGEERDLLLCDSCFHGDEDRDSIYDRVQDRRWKQTKSERQWKSGEPITDEDLGNV